ncbi:MAG: hypothetical protein GY821_06755 [Gammaproteobacteria bacterium]|nr:hypothetical protein [Gammaproteobacteria bacterium]
MRGHTRLVLFQSLSMLSDCLDNIYGLMRLYITFQNPKSALSTVQFSSLVTLNMLALAAVCTDIAFSIYSLAKDSNTFLGIVPWLTVATHLLNIAIDITQTCLFIARMNRVLAESEKNLNLSLANVDDNEGSTHSNIGLWTDNTTPLPVTTI